MGGVNVTAVEYEKEIADLYSEYYPDDTVIVSDAHEYLLLNYKSYDFIWSSPPCPTHSRPRMWASKGGRYDAIYPDMKLYEEIIFLKYFSKVPFVVENVIPYYEPLIKADIRIGRHLFWTNFKIKSLPQKQGKTQVWATSSTTNNFGFDISDVKMNTRKDKLIRNLVDPNIGYHLFKEAFENPKDLFSDLK